MTNGFKVKMEEDKEPAVLRMLGGQYVEDSHRITVTIDNETTPYEKARDKDYAFSATLYLEDLYSLIISATITDFGVKTEEDELVQNLDRHPIRLSIDRVDNRQSLVHLKGCFHCDALAFDQLGGGFYAKLKLGVVFKKVQALPFQELIFEAVITQDVSKKLSFFSYVSAIEAILAMHVGRYTKTVPQVLTESIERLRLLEKLHLAAELKHEATPIERMGIGPELLSTFKTVVGLRNNIAHTRENVEVKSADLFDAAYCLALVFGLLEEGMTELKALRIYFYPKARS